MEIVTVPLELVRIGQRLRAVDYDHVGELERSIAQVGLLNPITVMRGKVYVGDYIPQADGFWIVAGVHRFHAVKRLGWDEIPVHVVDLADLERELAQIDENLAGPVLSKQDRYIFTHRKKIIYEALYPETRGGVAGAHAANAAMGKANDASGKMTFASREAKKRGVSRSTVERDARRGAVLDNEAMAALRGSGLDDGRNLDAVARLPPDHQREVSRLVAIGHVEEARKMLSGELAYLRQSRARLRTQNRAWKALSVEERRAWIAANRGELERELGVHPKLRTKPKLRIVGGNPDDGQEPA